MILIAFGSESGEREISLQSASFVEQCLKMVSLEEEFVIAEITIDNFQDAIEQYKPRCVFNAMHGAFGEDGCLQNLLDFYQIPYTHSGAGASFIGMNKILSKSIMGRMGVPFANGISVSPQDLFAGDIIKIVENKVAENKLKGSRFIIKPSDMGSSLYVLELDLGKKQKFADALEVLRESQRARGGRQCPGTYILEEMCVGRELDVVVFDATEGDPIVGVAEVIGAGEIYTYEKKYYSENSVVNFSPNIREDIKQELCEYALIMHKGIGCKGVTRSEFILEEQEGGKHKVYALEINTHPGLRKTSCAIRIPNLVCGITPEKMILSLINQASFSRWPNKPCQN